MAVEANPWIPVVGTLGGALFGGVVSFLGGIIGQWMTLKREREAREHEIEISKRSLWQEFQVKTLINLQDALDRMNRASFRTADLAGKVAQGIIPMERAIESEAAYHSARNRAIKLMARIEDSHVRTLSSELCALAEEIKTLGIMFVDKHRYDTTLLNSKYADLNRKFAEANDRIGDAIRGSHRPEQR